MKLSVDNTIGQYFAVKSVDFRRLQRIQGWENRTRHPDPKKDDYTFYQLMGTIAKDLHRVTKAFDFSQIPNQPAILDMCFAPGGFATFALEECPDACIKAMTLPFEQGGREVHLSHKNLEVESLDVTMLAADMGITKDDVPRSQPDSNAFIFRKTFSAKDNFDLALCGGYIARYQPRSQLRELVEVSRLQISQLALSLEHLKPGGTLVILLHDLGTWRTIKLLHTLDKFSHVDLYKHDNICADLSSFYGVAKNVQSDGPLAAKAVADWKEEWKILSLNPLNENAKPNEGFLADNEGVQEVLKEFGEKVVRMGRRVWKTQERALSKAPPNVSSRGRDSSDWRASMSHS
ncbi:hypothetical protein B0J13DRAFT_646374 [Dactylonectria estremocensis]|uniref:Ribosomal RNA methyltransferase FtsJ domain-containing protein n=1 Tax=Dactylonectria estremocensis TaxID=1079267 RepID=A0A9P9DUG5_9HYPO|nr:hypothetical protein B0J13DRAFT_646374 [Dactylonectria estremocensis]